MPPIFGWAVITLGIGPQSSFHYFGVSIMLSVCFNLPTYPFVIYACIYLLNTHCVQKKADTKLMVVTGNS